MGSFFPAWLLCAAIGVAAAAVARIAFGFLQLNDLLFAPLLTYVAFAVTVCLLTWLIWFGH